MGLQLIVELDVILHFLTPHDFTKSHSNLSMLVSAVILVKDKNDTMKAWLP